MSLPKQISHTLPSSPTTTHHHHSSSSDFQFIVSLSPPKSSATNLRPADELFYNGQLLPLHLSPNNCMVHNVLATTTTTTVRHSSDYHSSFSSDSSGARSFSSDSSRPSSATEDDKDGSQTQTFISKQEKKLLSRNHFSFNGFSRKPAAITTKADPATVTGSSLKEKIRKYLKKLSNFHGEKSIASMVKRDDVNSYSFPGDLRFLSRTSCVSSCPSTMPSSPDPSGVLCRKTIVGGYSNSWSSTEEVQSAIQGAIAHCKNSMTAE